MMNKLMNIVSLFLVFAGVSCQNDELPFFSETKFIYIPQVNGVDSIHYSFLYSQGRDMEEIFIPVKYTGKMLLEDATYQVEIVKDRTTAVAGEYDLKTIHTFRAGRYDDTLRVVIKDSPRLMNESVDLMIRVVSNEYFEASHRDSSEIKISYTHEISKPDWWNKEVTDSYLGEYSVTKLTEFVLIYSGDYGQLDGSGKLHYARKFKSHLEQRKANGNPLYHEGKEVTVPVIG